MWLYNTTSEFVKTAESLNLSEMVITALQNWAETVGRAQTNRTKCYFRSPNNKFEIWTARIPNPDANRGSSGGYRLIYFFLLETNSIYLDRIEKRSDLGGKTEHPKDQQKFTRYLNELKSSLLSEIDPV